MQGFYIIFPFLSDNSNCLKITNYLLIKQTTGFSFCYCYTDCQTTNRCTLTYSGLLKIRKDFLNPPHPSPTNWKTDRQTYWKAGRHTKRQTYLQEDRHTYILTYIHTYIHTGRQTYLQSDRKPYVHTEKQTDEHVN